MKDNIYAGGLISESERAFYSIKTNNPIMTIKDTLLSQITELGKEENVSTALTKLKKLKTEIENQKDETETVLYDEEIPEDTEISDCESKIKETTIWEACETGKLEIVKCFIQEQPDLLNKEHEEMGVTPLMIASYTNLEIVKFLVKKEADLNLQSIGDEDGKFIGCTALMIAIKAKNTEVSKFLIENNAELNLQMSKTDNLYPGYTALMFAAEEEQIEIVEKLIDKGANLNTQSKGSIYYAGWTALMFAIEAKNMEIVKMFIEAKADLKIKTSKKDQEYSGFTALHIALYEEYIEFAKILIEANVGLNIQTSKTGDYTVDYAGYTALMFAVDSKDIGIVKKLINAKVDLNIQSSDEDGTYPKYTALMIAVESDYPEIVAELVNAGADKTITNKDGKTACELAGDNEDLKKLVCESNPPPETTENNTSNGGNPLEEKYNETNVNSAISSSSGKTKELLEGYCEINNYYYDEIRAIDDAFLPHSAKNIPPKITRLLDKIDPGYTYLKSVLEKKKKTPRMNVFAKDLSKVECEKTENNTYNGENPLEEKYNETNVSSAISGSSGKTKRLLESYCVVNNEAFTVYKKAHVFRRPPSTEMKQIINDFLAELPSEYTYLHSELKKKLTNQTYIPKITEENCASKINTSTLMNAIATKADIQDIKNIINEDVSVVNKSKEGMSPLHLAVLTNRLDVVKLLVDNGATDIQGALNFAIEKKKKQTIIDYLQEQIDK